MRLLNWTPIVNASITNLSKSRAKVTYQNTPCNCFPSKFNVWLYDTLEETLACTFRKEKCFQSCQKRFFFWSVISYTWSEYRNLRSIWTLFTQFLSQCVQPLTNLKNIFCKTQIQYIHKTSEATLHRCFYKTLVFFINCLKTVPTYTRKIISKIRFQSNTNKLFFLNYFSM